MFAPKIGATNSADSSIVRYTSSDDSPQLHVGGFWSDTGMSSHTVVRFNHRSETNSKQLLYRLARADVWCASAFTRGSLPRNLQTLLGCQCAKRTSGTFFLRDEKAEIVFPPVGGRLFFPLRERRGRSRPGAVKQLKRVEALAAIRESECIFTHERTRGETAFRVEADKPAER